VAITLVLGACGASGSGLDRPVDAFAAAARSNTQTVDAAADRLATAEFTVRKLTALAERHQVRPADGSCGLTSEACTLVVRTDPGDAGTPLLQGNDDLKNVQRLARALQGYAVALDRIADADTRGQVETATGRVADALADLGETGARVAQALGLDPSPAQPALSLARPLGSAVAYVGGAYVERLKLQALRRATAAAEGELSAPDQGPLAEATRIFAEALEKVAEARRAPFANAVTDAQAAYETDPSPESLDRLIVAAQAYDALLRQDPGAVPRALRAAHLELARALQGPELDDLADYYDAIDRLREEAGRARDAFAGLRPILLSRVEAFR
jgi:hypothetical protein